MPPYPGKGLGASALLAGAVGVALAVLGPVTAAYAEDPTPTPPAGAGGADPNLGPATPGEAVCTVSSNALNEITGMVATDKGIYVVEGGDTEQPTSVRIYTLNASSCKSSVKQFGVDPVDPEDLALGSDGALWVADIGDNGEGGPNRERIAFEKVDLGGGDPIVYRVVYPNKGKFHAAAMVLDKDDVPIIFTQAGGKAGIYRPSKALVPNAQQNLPVLEKLGDFTPKKTGTSNGAGPVGNSIVTGAAKSPDGKKVVIRTRSDAYEFTVGDDGDIVKAITETDPLITPLPDEPQGEAISYSADGSKFLTLSIKPADASENPKLLSYAPFVPAANDPNATAGPENLPEEAGAGQSWLDKLSFSELTRIVAAVGVVGLVLAIAGIVGIRRARRRRREEEEYDDYDDYDDEPPRRGRGRGRDDRGYGPRDPQYAEYGYGDNGYGGGGYADNGYGSNGYASSGYGQAQAADPAGNGYAAAGYGGQAYGQGQGYAEGGSYAQYGADQYGQQQYAGYDPYGQPQYGGQYGGDQNYGTGGYGGQAQAYGQYGDGYGGGYEDDFDPLHDPRRR
jgi:hypothetical protein